MSPEPAAAAEWRLDQLRTGQSAQLTVTVTDEAVAAFGRLTGDGSPLHVDAQFARRTRFRGRIAHGMLAASYLSTLVGMRLPGKYATLLSQRLRYIKPVRAGDTLTITGTITDVQAATGRVQLRVAIRNQRRDVVIDGDVEALVSAPPGKGLTMSELKREALGLDFAGQTVLVTGASRGIGQATAVLFAHHGARVALNYFQGRDDAEATVRDIEAHGGQAIALQADVRDAAQVARMVAQAQERLGGVDILVHGAMTQAAAQPFEQTRWDDFQADVDVALKGAVHAIQAVLPGMLARGRGRVITVTTVSINGTPPPGSSRYVAAKSALLGLTRALAVEYAPKGIAFNVVSPGLTDTDLVNHLPDVIKQKAAAEIPARKLGTPLDVAKAIVVMASSYTDYVVGGQLLVCGGSTVV